MIEIFIILMSWASSLSGYPMPEPENMPVVIFMPHEFFVAYACGGVECTVEGWYNDKGYVYIDDSIGGVDSGHETSVIVHEFVHYLQHKSELFDPKSCEDRMYREREAYGVQNAYLVRALVRIPNVTVRPMRCKDE